MQARAEAFKALGREICLSGSGRRGRGLIEVRGFILVAQGLGRLACLYFMKLTSPHVGNEIAKARFN